MQSAILPSLDHASLQDWECVYEPSEDTFLLCDALLMAGETIKSKMPSIAVEIGCGSGCAIVYLASLLQNHGVRCSYFATDINLQAGALALRTAASNSVRLDVITADLLSGLDSQLSNKIDVLLFNPPYVPTPNEEVFGGVLRSTPYSSGETIRAAWAGGDRGRLVIDRFLPQLKKLLAPGGLCFLVLVEENCPLEISRILEIDGLKSSIFLKKRARNEGLMIMKIEKPHS